MSPVDEHAVFDAPPHGCVGAKRLPAGQVFAVEERNGLAELHLGQVGPRRQGRSAPARELCPAEFAAVGSGFDGNEFQVVARQSRRDGFGDFLALVRSTSLNLDARDHESVAFDFDRGHRFHAAAAPEDTGLQLAVHFFNAQPAGAAAGDGQCPMADIRVVGVGGKAAYGRGQHNDCAEDGSVHEEILSTGSHGIASPATDCF